ncbi:MAG: acyltransferase family protein [Chthoniobacterales bacterium]
MKSSAGTYYIALDHVRALAIVMICAWHFMHSTNGYPVAFSYVPAIFPLALFSEGHTGVALFMTLSGYLFAKLLESKKISYPRLMWNRALRILPLLSLVVLVVGVMSVAQGASLSHYCLSIAKGVFLPFLPNGGWAVTVEFHYYLILPLLLWMLAKSPLWPLALVVAAISLRLLIYHERGEIQSLAYFTIIGRIDQFVLGMLLCQCRSYFSRRHSLALVTILGFMLIYWGFDYLGGFAAGLDQGGLGAFWIILPTIEGLAYGVAIAWYDTSFSPSNSGVSKFVGRLGQYSYSIFLLHFFVVFQAARFVNERIMDISNFYLALLWSFVFVAMMMVPGYLSFRFIESPFLKLRRNYIISSGSSCGVLPEKARAVP